MINTKLIGGTLLIIGTALGAGMLALPVVLAPSGFVASTILQLACWSGMTLGAFFILEVNLWLPEKTSLISMARLTLGRWAEVITWLSCLMLLFALLAAYTSTGGDILQDQFERLGWHLSESISALIFMGLLGSIVLLGTENIDLANRALLFVKMSTYLVLTFSILPFIKLKHLAISHPLTLLPVAATVVTAYGFAVLVPTLRDYFHSDVKQLRRVLLTGSLITLSCYILWDLAVLGLLPLKGEDGLLAALHSDRSTTVMINNINATVNHTTIATASHFFSTVCTATSFLGVSISLVDFIADGIKVDKMTKKGALVYLFTYLPPLTIVWFYPGAFLHALNYGGLLCAILLMLLPGLMVWNGRYHRSLGKGYQVWGGKVLPALLIIFSSGIILTDVISQAVIS